MRSPARIAGAILLLAMALGTFTLWIGIPVGAMWAASQLAESSAGHFLIALPMALAGMAIFAAFLVWLNRLYLRVIGSFVADPEDEEEVSRIVRGPLEPLLVGSLIVALIALFVWFFFFAENPSPQVI